MENSAGTCRRYNTRPSLFCFPASCFHFATSACQGKVWCARLYVTPIFGYSAGLKFALRWGRGAFGILNLCKLKPSPYKTISTTLNMFFTGTMGTANLVRYRDILFQYLRQARKCNDPALLFRLCHDRLHPNISFLSKYVP
jgi:hypothetical protein